MIGIIVAMPSESKAVKEQIEGIKHQVISGKNTFTGKINGKDIVLMETGIGKVNAALTTQTMIDKFNPQLILNYGTAGGTNSSISAKKYYLIEKACQFDFDIRELDKVPLGYIQEYDTVFFNNKTEKIDFLPKSVLATADRFSDSKEDNKDINNMGASIRDMEGGAIAEVCTCNNVPLYQIKGITDVYGSGLSGEQFYKNLVEVCDGFPSIVKNFLEKF